MIANKHISKIIIALMAVAVILSLLAVIFSDKLTDAFDGTGISMEYESKLFDTSEIITVDIQMNEEEWNKMLANASAEEYYVCDVVINGKKVKNVGIRPKGNTSLSAIAMDPDTDRYSLKLEFDHYVEEQTCYGLDKLILNNNYADATNMKEAIVYDMYQYIGADASLYNYAKVSVNGEYWGVYLALEAVEDSFMLRNYGTQDGELYKPESLGMGGGKDSSSDFNNKPSEMPGNMPGNIGTDNSNTNAESDGSGFDSSSMPNFDGSGFDPSSMPDFDGSGFDPGSMPNFDGSGFDPGSMPNFDGSGFDPSSMPNFDGSGSNSGEEGFNFNPSSMGGFSMGGGGANLNYTDDKLDSYSTIWEGSITDTSKSDRRRVVTALKNISEGTDLETYLDIDNILKYMAVHTFAVNMDSLSGSMAHNYYLYEYDGQLNMIPWDYNLSFGGMAMGNSATASEMINDAIDTPFSGTKFFDSLLENEVYLKRYHEYLNQLIDEYVDGGRFDEVYQRIRNQINTLVETDPTAFYSNDEYQVAVEMLYDTIKLRAESIRGQLIGTIPSTDAGQRENSSSLIDASSIDVNAMGQFSMGGNFGRDQNFGDSGNNRENDGTSESREQSSNSRRQPPTSFGDGMSFDRESFNGMTRQTNEQMKNLLSFGICFAAMIAALLGLKVYKRRKRA